MDRFVDKQFSRRRLIGAAGIVTAGVAVPSVFAPAAEAAGAKQKAKGAFYVGANLSGLETGSAIPGRPGTDFGLPTHADLDFLHARGLNTVRLPFKWERMQPALDGALDLDYLALAQDLIAYAASLGMGVIIDPHNFGRYAGQPLGGGVTAAQFADLWRRVAERLVGQPGVAGYDLMNEPHDMPAPTAWPDAAQAAIDAVRAVDMETTIVVEGDHWSSAWSWVAVNGNLHLTDPADNLVYSAHNYFDRDNSGTHFDWATEVAAGDQLQDPPGPLTTQIGVQRLTGYVDWLAEHGYRGLVGEMGTGNDDPHWLETLDITLAYCKSSHVAVTYWAAGPWFQAYPMGIEPQPDGRDTVQVAVLEKYSGAPGPKLYYVSGPQGGNAGQASEPFVVDYRGLISGNIVITPNDSGAGGLFSPRSLKLTSGFNGLGSFTYTPPAGAAADYSIGFTNGSGLTDPAALQYSTSPDIDWNSVATNVIALGRLRPEFTGNAVTLQRSSDAAQASFAFSPDGKLDQSAISSWSGGSDVLVVTVSDQGTKKRNAGKVASQNHDAPDQTQLNSSPADYPLLVADGLGGMPVLRFNQSRMDAVSPIDGLHGFTCFVVCKPTTVASMQRLLSWHFTQYLLLSGNGAGTWQQTGEPDLSLGIDPSAWHIYAVRYQGGYQRTTWVDGQQVATAPTATSAIRFQYDSHVNIGYFRWYPGVFFEGDLWGFLPFSVALTDPQMGAVWNTLSAATGIPV